MPRALSRYLALLGLVAIFVTPRGAEAALFGIFQNDADSSFADVEDAVNGAGHTATELTGLADADLAGIDVLWLLNGSNSGYGDIADAGAAFSNFLAGGGVISFHDRTVAEDEDMPGVGTVADFLPGAGGITFVRNFDDSEEIDILTGGTLVTNGPGGVIDDTSLDGGDNSSHGYAEADTLPVGAVSIFSRSADDEVVDFYYAVGDGFVYYSTIPLDFYLGDDDDELPDIAFRSIYAVNEAAFQASLLDDGGNGGIVPEPTTAVLLGLGLLGLAARRSVA